jgi:hypothetical protein
MANVCKRSYCPERSLLRTPITDRITWLKTISTCALPVNNILNISPVLLMKYAWTVILRVRLHHVWQDMGLENLEMGTGEPDVEDYFKGKIFAKPVLPDSLKRIDKNPMAKQVVPDVGSRLKLALQCLICFTPWSTYARTASSISLYGE